MSSPVKPDYSSRDYETIQLRVQRLVQSVFPDWTDFNAANFGNSLLKAMSWIGDVVSYHTDFWANESLPTYALLRKSIVSHARWIGYDLSGRTAAQATLNLETEDGNPHGKNIIIPAGTLFRVPSLVTPIDFESVSEAVISGSSATGTVLVEHSSTVSETFFSNGKSNQVFSLSEAPFVQGSMVVSAENGIYQKVTDFLQSEREDNHYMVGIDDEEYPFIRFSDGINGEVPIGQIDVTYTVGGGYEGNVDQNTITEILDEITDIDGDPVSLVITGHAKAQGGADAETIARAKAEAPGQLRVLNRTVTREDFEIIAETVGGVSRALCLTNNETAQVMENEAVCFVVALGDATASGKYRAAAPTQTLLNAVETAWNTTKPKQHTLRARAVGKAGTFLKSVNVEATVYFNENADLTRPTPSDPTVSGKALFDLLDDFFAIENSDNTDTDKVDFGFNLKDKNSDPAQELPWSVILNVINDYLGTRKIENDGLLLNGNSESVTLGMFQFPILGTVTIIDGDTGNTVYP